MKPGERKFIKRVQIVLVEAYERRDDPPGRDPVGIRRTVLAEHEHGIPDADVSKTVIRVIRDGL